MQLGKKTKGNKDCFMPNCKSVAGTALLCKGASTRNTKLIANKIFTEITDFLAYMPENW